MKVRYVDLHPDEFLAAIAGEMSPAELGVYWMICLLCYARGGEIDYDAEWLRAKFRPSRANGGVAPALEALIASGRVYRNGPKIGVRRVHEETMRALRRIHEASMSGSRGGRPSKKSNGLAKAPPFSREKLTINHQPSEERCHSREDDRGVDSGGGHQAHTRTREQPTVIDLHARATNGKGDRK